MAIRHEVNKGKSMNKKMIVGGYFVDLEGVRTQLPVISDPSISNIDELFSRLPEACKGVISIRYQQPPDVGPIELNVYIESGKFIPLLNDFDEEGECHVRTLKCDDCAESRFTPIMGENYPSQAITRNANLVCSILKEFVITRNVSVDLLS
jgi:hypothetical protein